MAYTKEEIFKQLEEMGAPRDSIVLLHSSLRAVGEVEGRGEGLLDILIDYFTSEGGLLCIPTHTWAFAGKELEDKITLDLLEPKTCVGTLPNIAANRPDAVRTLHPTHSMAVFGEKSRVLDFVSGEESVNTPAPENGCYGKILKNKGYIVLMGVGHNKDTFLHGVEEMLGVLNRISETTLKMTIRHKDGSLEVRHNHYHSAKGIPDVSANYPNFEPAFRYFGAIKDGFIGNAKTQLCSTEIMKNTLELIYKRANGVEILSSLSPVPEEYYK